jgi:hypothetical protein
MIKLPAGIGNGKLDGVLVLGDGISFGSTVRSGCGRGPVFPGDGLSYGDAIGLAQGNGYGNGPNSTNQGRYPYMLILRTIHE